MELHQVGGIWRKVQHAGILWYMPWKSRACTKGCQALNSLVDLGLPMLLVNRGDPLLRVLEQGPIA
jgi:hypothetical protein